MGGLIPSLELLLRQQRAVGSGPIARSTRYGPWFETPFVAFCFQKLRPSASKHVVSLVHRSDGRKRIDALAKVSGTLSFFLDQGGEWGHKRVRVIGK